MKVVRSLLVMFLNVILTGVTWFLVKDYFISKLGNDAVISGLIAIITHISIIVICAILYGVLLSMLIM